MDVENTIKDNKNVKMLSNKVAALLEIVAKYGVQLVNEVACIVNEQNKIVKEMSM